MRTNQLISATSGFCMCLFACATSFGADSTYQDWQFTNSASLAVPTVATNALGVATATVEVGYLAEGWMSDFAGFGTQTGLWGLGYQDVDDKERDTRGRVSLSIPLPMPASGTGNTHTDLKVRIVQFVDGILLNGDLTFSISGGTLLGRSVIETPPGLGGSWVEDEFSWRLAPSPQQVSLCITGAVAGTLLDRIRVETSTVSEASQLVITSVEKRGQMLAISWAGGIPPYEVYVSASLTNNAPWQQVGLPVSGLSAEIPLEGPSGFVQVRGSN